MQITADISRSSKCVQSGITFILNAFSGMLNVFAQIFLVLEIKNIVSFIKMCSYRKRGCVTMRNYVELFLYNSMYNVALKFLLKYHSVENKFF